MSAAFSGASALNQPLNGWNVSNVTLHERAVFGGLRAIGYTKDTMYERHLADQSLSIIWKRET